MLESLSSRWLGPKKLELPVSAYGKLPVYKDFIRHRLAGRDAQELKQWLDRGMSRHWHEREECRNHEIESHGLFLSFAGTGRFVAGLLWGSADEGSLRQFPFTLFVPLPAGRTGFSQLAGIAAMSEVIRQLERLREALAGAGSIQDVHGILGPATIEVVKPSEKDVLQHLAEELEPLTEARFAASLYPESAGQEWPALRAFLDRSAERARAGQKEWALRLPLSELLSPGWQASLWWSLLRPGRGATPTVNLIFPAAAGGTGLSLLRRTLRPDDVVLLHPNLSDYEGIEDLRTTVPGTSPAADGAAEASGLPDVIGANGASSESDADADGESGGDDARDGEERSLASIFGLETEAMR